MIHAFEAYNLKRFRSPGVSYPLEGTQVALIVESGGKRVYQTGDSNYLPSMNALRDITLALLLILGLALMDVDKAVEATLGIEPEMLMPMHWRNSDPKEFKAKVEARSELKIIMMKAG